MALEFITLPVEQPSKAMKAAKAESPIPTPLHGFPAPSPTAKTAVLATAVAPKQQQEHPPQKDPPVQPPQQQEGEEQQQPRRARKVKRPERFNDGDDSATCDEAPATSLALATSANLDAKSSSERTSPVTAPSTPAMTPLPSPALANKRSSKEREGGAASSARIPGAAGAPPPPPPSSFSSDVVDDDELFDFFELEAAPLAEEASLGPLPARRTSAGAGAGSRQPLEQVVEAVYEKTEEEVMLDILRGFEDEIGPDLRAVWDAAGKPAPIESSLLWDVVATPAMMRQHAAHTRKVHASAAAEGADDSAALAEDE